MWGEENARVGNIKFKGLEAEMTLEHLRNGKKSGVVKCKIRRFIRSEFGGEAKYQIM